MLVHRPELQAALLDVLGRDAVRFDSPVTRFEESGPRVTAALASGERLEADLLVGADGIRSAVRGALLDDGEPRHAGATCWRGVTGFDLEADSASNWWGRGGEFGLYPLPDARVCWFAVHNRTARRGDPEPRRKADAIAAFASWPGIVPEVMRATDDRDVLQNDLYDRPPTHRWSRGHVVPVGDAAHPMLPNIAQGACQALEDAAALGEALAGHPVEQALCVYEEGRVSVANRLIIQARRTSRLVQSTNPFLTAGRDLVVRSLPHSLLVRQLDALMGDTRPATA